MTDQHEPTPEELLDEAIEKMAMPWTLEPDEYDFSWRGYKCMCMRNQHSQTWLGYVLLPQVHAFNDSGIFKKYVYEELDVHGGVTFYDRVPKMDAMLIGFDCNHLGDYAPASSITPIDDPRELKYRTLSFVRKELRNLVDQIIKFDPANVRSKS
jgi:hypothetical protein